jgi:hypothetical protein
VFDVLHLNGWVRDAVYDESKRDFLWWHHVLDVVCLLNVEATAASRFPPVQFTGAVGQASARLPVPGRGEPEGHDLKSVRVAQEGSLAAVGAAILAGLGAGTVPVGPLLQLGEGLSGFGPLSAAARAAGQVLPGASAPNDLGVRPGVPPVGPGRPVGAPGQVRGTGYPPAPLRGDLDAMLKPGQTRQEFFDSLGPTPGSDLDFFQQQGFGDLFAGPEPQPPGRPRPRPPGGRGGPAGGSVPELDILSGVRPGIVSDRPTVPWTDVELRERLRRPRRPLMVWLNSGPRGDAEFMLLSPYPGLETDAQGGPVCTVLDLPEVHGVQTAVLRVQFETWEASPPSASPLGVPALVSNRWGMAFAWDRETHLKRQDVSGTAVFRLDALALNRLTADTLRQQFWHPIPAGYAREVKRVEQNAGGDAIEYEFSDHEVLMSNPGGTEYGVVQLEAEQEMSFTGYDSPTEAP